MCDEKGPKDSRETFGIKKEKKKKNKTKGIQVELTHPDAYGFDVELKP